MGLGELYISLLLLKSMSLQQAQLYSFCAQTTDPLACYESIPSRLDLQDSMLYGPEPPVRYTPGQFYHYIDPQPLHSASEQACVPTPRPESSCH